MLARVADNLFWMGRYIERSEHIARYVNVNYFSSLDAPNHISQSRQFVLKSLLSMIGNPVLDRETVLNEEAVIYDIALNTESSISIINCIKKVRENANGARDLISTELFESINKFYHFLNNYDVEYFKKRGLYDYAVKVTEHTAILRQRIRGTLLHDEIYSIILMGVNIERAMQIIRIINSKYQDAVFAKEDVNSNFSNSYEWTTLLKCAESYDMMRRFYKKSPSMTSTLEFLVLNPLCPRSIMNCLNQVCKHLSTLEPNIFPEKQSTHFLAGKLRSKFQFLTIEEIETNIQEFIITTLDELYEIAAKMDEEFFSY